MITLETTITHTEKKELKISTPSFWKEPTYEYDRYRAVLDETTYVEVTRMYNGDVRKIENSTVRRRKWDIQQAQQNWDIITEKEFFSAYDDAYESMRLQPKLSVSDSLRAEAFENFRQENPL